MLSSNYLVKCRLRDRGWHRLIQKAIAAIGLAPRTFGRNHELMLTHTGRKCLIPKSLTRTACGPVASLVSVKLHAAVTLMLELVPLPDPGNERDRVLTPEEWNRLYGAAPDHLKPILVIAFQLWHALGGDHEPYLELCGHPEELFARSLQYLRQAEDAKCVLAVDEVEVTPQRISGHIVTPCRRSLSH